MAARSFVWVRLADAMVKVTLAGVEDGADLTKAAYLELGLDKKGLALVDIRLFRTMDGARGDAILPQDTGDRLPSPSSIVEAVLAPGGAGAWGWRDCHAQSAIAHSLCAWVLVVCDLLIVQ